MEELTASESIRGKQTLAEQQRGLCFLYGRFDCGWPKLTSSEASAKAS
jgi:hypothetical protein